MESLPLKVLDFGLQMKVVCGALSHKMDELILRKHQVDGTKLLIYIYIHVIYFFIRIR